MTLRDWRPWHIGLLWAVGMAVVWFLLRDQPSTFSGASTSGSLQGASAPVVPLAVAFVVTVSLVVVTRRWMRSQNGRSG
jgi:hypothetical protein